MSLSDATRLADLASTAPDFENINATGMVTTTVLYVGTAVTIMDVGVNATGVITATGGLDAIGIQSGGVDIATGAITALNFVGTGNTFLLNGTTVDISISGSSGAAGTDNINTGTAATFSSSVAIADSITHLGDNSSIRFPEADAFAIETAGSERLRVNSSGNVTIGSGVTLNNAGTIQANSSIQSNSAFFTQSYFHSGAGGNGGAGVRVDDTGFIEIRGDNTDAFRLRGTSSGEQISMDASIGSVTIASSIFHMGDTNTYFGFPEADRFTVNTGGNEVVRVTSAGRLGINNSSPNSTLDVAGSSADIRITSTGQNRSVLSNDGSGLTISQIGSANIIFSTNSEERARIFSTGRVGVGTDTNSNSNIAGTGYPNLIQIRGTDQGSGLGVGNFGFPARIDIIRDRAEGDISNGDELGFLSFGAGHNTAVQRASINCHAETSGGSGVNRGGQLRIGTADDGSAGVTERMRITNTGNILMNYNAGSATGVTQLADGSGASPSLAFWNDTDTGIFRATNNTLNFATGGSDRVRIDPNGHLEIDYDSSNNSVIMFGYSTGVRIQASSSTGHQDFYTNSAIRIRNLYNGQGTEFSNQNSVRPTTDNAVDLGSSGQRYDDVFATNGTIQTSDSRLKQEVVTSVLGIDFVKALRPVSYKWIEGKKVPIVDGTDENGDNTYRTDDNGNWTYESRAGARRHWGFIAQEVKQAVDDAGVDFAGWTLSDKDDPDSTQSLRYEEFIAPLTKALQEAITKIETLETQNTAQQAQIDDLIARVTALES